MRAHFSLGMVLVLGAVTAAACANDNPSRPRILPNGGRGGSGNAGKGSGGTKPGAAGSAGEDTSNGMAGAENAGAGTGGKGGSGGKGGTGTGGGAGQNDGSGGSSGTRGGRSGTGGSGNSGSGTGGNAGAGNQAGAELGGNGGEAGGGVVDGSGLYVGLTGSDSATGTRSDPFATLAHAASVALAGQTIIFLDGTFLTAATALAIPIPDGVNVIAENPGAVTLKTTTGPLMELLGSSAIDGLTFEGFDTSIRAYSTGDDTVTVTKSSFVNCANTTFTAIDVRGNAIVRLNGPTTQDWGNCPAFASLTESGSLKVSGGILHNTASFGSTAFIINDNSSLELTNLTATDGNRPLLLQYGSSTASIDNSTIKTLGNNVVTLNGSSSLTITDSDVSIDPAAALAYACIQTNMDGVGLIGLAGTHIHHCSDAINGVPPSALVIDNTEIDHMSFNGLEFSTGNGGAVTIFDSHFHDLASMGARFFGSGGGANVVTLSVLSTVFETSPEGVRLQGAAGSIYDFGNVDAPGGNTFHATSTGLYLLTASGTEVSAVGNTWVPNVQGADTDGHYPSSPNVTTGTGQNYTIAYGATLRLSQ